MCQEISLKYREFIKKAASDIEALRHSVNKLAQAVIPDFHFMNYEVSLFWSCDASPIGMCVFTLDDMGRRTNCRYCGDPDERK